MTQLSHRFRGSAPTRPAQEGLGPNGFAGGTAAEARASELPEPGEAFLHLDFFRLPARGTSVAEARRRVGELLDRWGVAEHVLDDATLVVSELFTNALVHTDSAEITCRLQTTAESVYLAIADQGCGPTGPVVREPDAESGRGLMLVTALAQIWGVIAETERGRTVWAVLSRAAGDDANW